MDHFLLLNLLSLNIILLFSGSCSSGRIGEKGLIFNGGRDEIVSFFLEMQITVQDLFLSPKINIYYKF